MMTSLIVYAPNERSPFVGNITGVTGRLQLQRFEELLNAVKGQGISGRAISHPFVKVATQIASARITLASVLAADTVTLNGQALTAVSGAPADNQFDISGTDTADATSFVAAISLSSTALVSSHLRASNKRAVVTAASVAVGDTVEVAGVVLVAKTSSAAASNSGLSINEFSRTGTDAQCATSLTSAINSHPTLSQTVFAVATSAAVAVYERPIGVTQRISISTSNGTRLAITSSLTELTAGAVVHIESLIPGIAGNAATIASSNGTRLAIEGSVARLAGGTQSTFTY